MYIVCDNWKFPSTSWEFPYILFLSIGNFQVLVGNSQVHQISWLEIPKLIQLVGWEFPSSPNQWVGTSRPHAISGLEIPKLPQSMHWKFPNSLNQSVGNSQVYSISGLGIPKFTQSVGWEFPSSPNQLLGIPKYPKLISWEFPSVPNQLVGNYQALQISHLGIPKLTDQNTQYQSTLLELCN